MSAEFDLIRRWFTRDYDRSDILLGNGHDCAVISAPAGHGIAMSIDTLISGVHFPANASAEDIGHKCLAVNLSDLAASGATPRWFTLALTLPEVDEGWLAGFSKGLFELAERYQVALVGGDTTRGHLSITIQAMGIVPEDGLITRGGATAGDDIYVTGVLGDGALGLASLRGEVELSASDAWLTRQALHRPEPLVAAGMALRPYVTAMLDCSDGFAADLGHILEASIKGADVRLRSLPLSSAGKAWLDQGGAWDPIVSGGDDYQLIFTAPMSRRLEIAALLRTQSWTATWVGTIVDNPGLRFYDDVAGGFFEPRSSGYRHF